MELTKEEAEIALVEALRKKAEQLDTQRQLQEGAIRADDERRKQERMERANAKARQESPDKWCGLQHADGTVSYVPNPSNVRERSVLIAGTNYEHTREDADGVWIYRHLV